MRVRHDSCASCTKLVKNSGEGTAPYGAALKTSLSFPRRKWCIFSNDWSYRWINDRKYLAMSLWTISGLKPRLPVIKSIVKWIRETNVGLTSWPELYFQVWSVFKAGSTKMVLRFSVFNLAKHRIIFILQVLSVLDKGFSKLYRTRIARLNTGSVRTFACPE